ncbi:uncharacterized protein PG998_003819 [Apiospora kogelbergensis]|uniref:uncharacterized protein n=1 Tax=Apiospora kogelbergensis TaxID=1337665 RepID=UPI00312E0595
MAYSDVASHQSDGYHLRTTNSSSSDDDYSKEADSALLEVGLRGCGAGSSKNPRQWPWRSWLRRALRKLSPSFLHPWIRRKQHGGWELHPNPKPNPLSSTAWLDGLRGYAAFFVVWHHISLLYFPWSLHGGYEGRETDRLLQLPIVRLAISGAPHVFVFFVISGYALSHKTLRLLQEGGADKGEEAYAALASSAFRRHPRLFVPPVVLCLPVPLLAYAGWLGGQMPGAAAKAIDPTPLASLSEQFVDYARAALELADPLAHRDGWTWVYNTSLWTLPHEFRGSLLVYGALLALSRCNSIVRLLLTASMAVWALYHVHWPQFLFLSGMLLADSRLHSSHHTQGEEDPGSSSTLDGEWKSAAVSKHTNGWKSTVTCKWSNRFLQATIQVMSYLFILYVLGTPPWHLGGDKTPGYIWLAQHVPSRYIDAKLADYFWPSIAAVALVFVLDRSPLLQRLFMTPFARYLGRISYSLYLVHIPILQGLGLWAGQFFVGLMGPETDSGYVAGVAAAVVVVWALVVWAADLGWRFVDAPAVRFAGWAHRMVTMR